MSLSTIEAVYQLTGGVALAAAATAGVVTIGAYEKNTIPGDVAFVIVFIAGVAIATARIVNIATSSSLLNGQPLGDRVTLGSLVGVNIVLTTLVAAGVTAAGAWIVENI